MTNRAASVIVSNFNHNLAYRYNDAGVIKRLGPNTKNKLKMTCGTLGIEETAGASLHAYRVIAIVHRIMRRRVEEALDGRDGTGECRNGVGMKFCPFLLGNQRQFRRAPNLL